jgi:hypothetical protein
MTNDLYKHRISYKDVDEVVYEHTDTWGNYRIEYYDSDGYLIEERINSDGSVTYICHGGG